MRSRSDEPVILGAAMERVVRSLESGRRDRPVASAAALGGLFARWPEIVGDAVARHVETDRLDGDHLVVRVAEPAWATQVRLLSDTINARILAVTGATVRTLEVRVTGRPR